MGQSLQEPRRAADDVVRVHEEINSHGDDEGAEEDRGEIF